MKKDLFFNLPVFLLIALISASFITNCAPKRVHPSLRPHKNPPASQIIKKANALLRDNPEDAEAHFQLGIVYSHLDSVSLAFKHFEKSMEYDPSPKTLENANRNIKHNYSKQFYMGQAALKAGDYEMTADFYRRATLADPRNWEGYYHLALTLIRLGPNNYSKARKLLEEAREKATEDYIGRINRVLEEIRR